MPADNYPDINKRLSNRENYPESPVFAFTDLFTGVVFLLLIVIATLSLTYRSEIIQKEPEPAQANQLSNQIQALKNKLGNEELSNQQIIFALQKIEQQVKVLFQDKQELQAAFSDIEKQLLQTNSDFEKQKQLHQQQIKLHQQQQQALHQQLEKVKKTKLIPQALLAELKQIFQQQQIPATIDSDNGTIHFADSLLFATNSSTITTQGKKILKQLAEIFNQVLPCYSYQEISNDSICKNQGQKQIEAIFIEGHTDNVPFASESYDNWQLSMSRAKETYEQLIVVSPQLSKLKNRSLQPLFSLSAYGDTRPIASNETQQGRAKNRRIDIRLISFGFTIDKL